jgi:hypothetical protein
MTGQLKIGVFHSKVILFFTLCFRSGKMNVQNFQNIRYKNQNG